MNIQYISMTIVGLDPTCLLGKKPTGEESVNALDMKENGYLHIVCTTTVAEKFSSNATHYQKQIQSEALPLNGTLLCDLARSEISKLVKMSLDDAPLEEK